MCVAAYGARQGLAYQGADLVVSEHIGADDGAGRGVAAAPDGPRRRTSRPARSAPSPCAPRSRPARRGLVDADLVQQRRVGESDGRDRNAGNFQAFITQLGKVHPGIVGPGRRVTVPAAAIGPCGPSAPATPDLNQHRPDAKLAGDLHQAQHEQKRAPGNWTGKTWARIVIGVIILVYVILFIVFNSTSVKIDFVFFSVRSQLWVGFLVCFVLGGVLGAAFTTYRKKNGKSASKPQAS